MTEELEEHLEAIKELFETCGRNIKDIGISVHEYNKLKDRLEKEKQRTADLRDELRSYMATLAENIESMRLSYKSGFEAGYAEGVCARD